MFSKLISTKTFSRVAFKAPKMATISARSFSAPAAAAPSSDVVIPDIVDTLEWVISSPPPIHQFAEPPVITVVRSNDLAMTLTRPSHNSMKTANALGQRVAYRYPGTLLKGSLVQRYKRFLADIDFSSSNHINKSDQESDVKTVYCPNTGSMYGLLPSEIVPRPCVCSVAPLGSTRKYDNTLEMIMDNGAWVGIHSALANNIVKNCLLQGWIDEYSGFNVLNSEVTVSQHCKLDFELLWTNSTDTENTGSTIPHTTRSKATTRKRKISQSSKISSTDEKGSSKVEVISHPASAVVSPTRRVLLEVKSVTLAVPVPSPGTNVPGATLGSNTQIYSAQFPDCVSTRAQKHCQYLTDHVTQSRGEAAILFLIQRDDCTYFSASTFDPEYGKLLSRASQAGVRILPYVCKLNPEDGVIELVRKVPFVDSYLDLSLS